MRSLQRAEGISHRGLALEAESGSGVGLGRLVLVSLNVLVTRRAVGEAGDTSAAGTDRFLCYSSRLGTSLDCDACYALCSGPGPACLC